MKRLEQIEVLFLEIEASANQDETTQVLLADFVSSAVRYAGLRAAWQISPMEKRLEMDRNRTCAHNALIDSCNILSRAMVQRGMSAEWRTELGQDRKNIGDFACYLHCLLGLRAR